MTNMLRMTSKKVRDVVDIIGLLKVVKFDLLKHSKFSTKTKYVLILVYYYVYLQILML